MDADLVRRLVGDEGGRLLDEIGRYADAEALAVASRLRAGGHDPALVAAAILAARSTQLPSDPGTVSGAWVITAANIPPDVFKTMEKYITGSTMVYRVQAIGYLDGGGPVAVIARP